MLERRAGRNDAGGHRRAARAWARFVPAARERVAKVDRCGMRGEWGVGRLPRRRLLRRLVPPPTLPCLCVCV